MSKRLSKFKPDPRLWSPEQVAARLNRSVPWLYEHLPRLRQLGFPKKDPELGGWDSKAIELWLDRRGSIAASVEVEQQMLEAIHA